jgi:hypothetical protein
MPHERARDLLVVLESDRGRASGSARISSRRSKPVAPDVEIEQPAIGLQPRPGDGAIAVLPDPDLPLVLASPRAGGAPR